MIILTINCLIKFLICVFYTSLEVLSQDVKMTPMGISLKTQGVFLVAWSVIRSTDLFKIQILKWKESLILFIFQETIVSRYGIVYFCLATLSCARWKSAASLLTSSQSDILTFHNNVLIPLYFRKFKLSFQIKVDNSLRFTGMAVNSGEILFWISPLLCWRHEILYVIFLQLSFSFTQK